MFIPKKRLLWESKAIEKAKDIKKRKNQSHEDFIRLHNPTLIEQLDQIYSYDNACSVKVYLLEPNTLNKISQAISSETDLTNVCTTPRVFDKNSIDIGEYYLAKIDKLHENSYKIWYVDFKESVYSFGFSQTDKYIRTVKSNIYIKNSLMFIRGHNSSIPNILDKFLVDFGLSKTDINSLMPVNKLHDITSKLKRLDSINISTIKMEMENPIEGVPANYVTFSVPIEENGDIENIDINDDTAKIIMDSSNISKSFEYIYEDNGYKESCTLAITTVGSAIRIIGRVSDNAIFNLAIGIKESYEQLQ